LLNVDAFSSHSGKEGSNDSRLCVVKMFPHYTPTPDYVTVIEPRGLFDRSHAQELCQQIGTLVKRGERSVLLDLSSVEGIDSFGLGGLLSALKLMRRQGGQLYLCAPNDRVDLALQMSHMDRVFQTFQSRTDFLSSFGDRQALS
jgi:anti-sigma B factor antagonist